MSLEKIIGMVKSVLAMLAPGLKSEDSKHGIKELRELVKGCFMVSIVLIKKFRDGVQFTDFTSFYTHITTDEEFKAVMLAAYEGYELVPAEVKDIDAGEGLEVACDVLDFVPQVTEALKKEEAEVAAEDVEVKA